MDLNFENLTNAHIITDDIFIVVSDLGPMGDHDHDKMPTPSVKSVQESQLKTQCCQMYFQSKTGSLLWSFGTY